MSSGIHHYIHLTNNILHLLAASTWIGAMVAYIILLPSENVQQPSNVKTLVSSLTGFAKVGTYVVIILVITGILNFYYISFGAEDKPISLEGVFSSYNISLLVKISFFCMMLLFAATNRFLLTPKLDLMLSQGNYSQGLKLIKTSMLIECTIGLLLIATVAYLGINSPAN
ncbi:CopD family protein [Providencia rettgeri]|uniref:CopD family protein n=1 Tax=Providencia rettgeri TaxID=587 RepID=UPI0034E0AFA2